VYRLQIARPVVDLRRSLGEQFRDPPCIPPIHRRRQHRDLPRTLPKRVVSGDSPPRATSSMGHAYQTPAGFQLPPLQAVSYQLLIVPRQQPLIA
jgi:hypothetical protein